MIKKAKDDIAYSYENAILFLQISRVFVECFQDTFKDNAERGQYNGR